MGLLGHPTVAADAVSASVLGLYIVFYCGYSTTPRKSRLW